RRAGTTEGVEPQNAVAGIDRLFHAGAGDHSVLRLEANEPVFIKDRAIPASLRADDTARYRGPTQDARPHRSVTPQPRRVHNGALMPATATYHGRRAAAIENADLRVTVLEEGGHIAEIFDKRAGVNPLWTPPWPSLEPSSFDRLR